MTKLQACLKLIITSILSAVFIFGIVQAVPKVYADDQSIPADRTQPFTIRFAYGNINNDTDIENSQISLKLEGDGFEFIANSFFDLYYPTVNGQSSVEANCKTPQTDILIYPINSSLLSNNILTYSPQSSKNTDITGGSSTPSTLPAKNTGCISAQFKVKSGATVGQKTIVTYNPNSGNSPSYQDANKPVQNILNIKVGPRANDTLTTQAPVTTPVSSSSQTLVPVTTPAISKSTVSVAPALPTSGTLNLSNKAGETKSITNPLVNISKIEVSLDKDVKGDITYKDINNTGACTGTVSGNRIVSKDFSYSFDKSLIKTMKVTFTVPSGTSGIKAFSCSSPAVETQITSLGNNTYTAVIPASSTFLVTATTTTTRTGGLESSMIIIGSVILIGTLVVWFKTRRKLLKVTLSEKNR